MLAYTYLGRGDLRLLEKPKPALLEDRDAVVRVTLSSICTSDLHIKHGSVPRAAPGVTLGHEMVGVVEEVGAAVAKVKPGDRVAVNVETFKTGGVDGCNCAETLDLIARGRLDTTGLVTHTYPLRDIAAAYDLFEHRRDGVVKVAIDMTL